jgi:hypothetical protein
MLESGSMHSGKNARSKPHDPHAGRRLAEAVAASSGAADPEAFAAALAQHALEPASYEASIRGAAGRRLSAGRMMIERASARVLDAVARAVDVELPPLAGLWVERAREVGVPLIVGWDLRGRTERRCVKLYINTSDAAQTIRARLCAALVPAAIGDDLPAVLGMNICATGQIETKLYRQAADAQSLTSGLTSRARELADGARREGADSGGVLSFDVHHDTLEPRAFFVALRDPVGTERWHCVESLPGYEAGAIAALLPFAPAPPRSVGISLSDDTWTLYCKPVHSSRAPEALEPTAIFRSDNVEVGLFVEPNERAERAFCRTAHHAISVRERDGAPEPHAIESLVQWFALRLRDAERDGVSVVGRLENPPPPWRQVI